MTTETLIETRPAPVEPTTPIKPSEAIRLGCLIAPVQITGHEIDGNGGACAWGAMRLGYGDDPRAVWDAELLLISAGAVPCPGDGRDTYHTEPLPMTWAIKHLSDGYCSEIETYIASGYMGWTRERIADWLAEQGL